MIKIIYKAKSIWPQFQRDLVKDAVAFAMNYYDVDDIVIKLCWLDDCHGMTIGGGRPRFHIRPDEDYELLLRTVFHEMTHVWQISSRKATFMSDGVKWKNRFYKVEDTNSQFFLYDAPWEKEALKAEKKMLKAYLKAVKSS